VVNRVEASGHLGLIKQDARMLRHKSKSCNKQKSHFAAFRAHWRLIRRSDQ
jgi:hypothetical protein